MKLLTWNIAILFLALNTSACVGRDNLPTSVAHPRVINDASGYEGVRAHFAFVANSTSISPELSLFSKNGAQAIKQLGQMQRELVQDMLADMKENPKESHISKRNLSFEEQCRVVRAVLSKYKPRFKEMARSVGTDFSDQQIDDMAQLAVPCRNNSFGALHIHSRLNRLPLRI